MSESAETCSPESSLYPKGTAHTLRTVFKTMSIKPQAPALCHTKGVDFSSMHLPDSEMVTQSPGPVHFKAVFPEVLGFCGNG